MSFNKSFKNDVFLSYSRVDNLNPIKGDGWVDIFFKAFEVAIARKIGQSDIVKIWRDVRQIDGSQLFDQTIENALDDSAILLCLLSPGYIRSEYCKKELNFFYQKASKDGTGLNIQDRNRIVYLRLDKMERDDMPPEFGRSTGFDMFDKNDPMDHVDPFQFEDKIDNKNYCDVIKKLSNAIVKTLEVINDGDQTNNYSGQTASLIKQIKCDSSKDNFSIYFADVPDSLIKTKYKTVTYLKKQGYIVVDGIPPPMEYKKHDIIIKEKLNEVDLSVHLLDDSPGKQIVDIDADLSYPQQQINLGFKHAKNQMIWTPLDMDIKSVKNDEYRAYLNELETKKERDYQLIKGRKSNLENDIEDLIKRLQEKVILDTSNGQQHVLLDTHFRDQLYASDISTQLLNSHIQPYLNPQEDNPEANLNLLAEMIKRVSKIVFIYGAISKEWILGRMSAALQLIVSNNFPVEDFIVFMVPPSKDPHDIQMRQKFMSVKIIDNSGSNIIEPQSIERMLERLP